MVSIIVPIYNAESVLARCLSSLEKQSYQDLEILLVDDGSTDTSSSICDRYCSEDSRFRYFFQKNQGCSSARNLGLKEAKGELIGFCDSDDWVSPDYYELLSKPFEDPLCDCSIGGYQISDGLDTSDHILPENDELIGVEKLTQRFLAYTQNSLLNSVCNKLFRRERITECFPTDMTCGEDLFFCMNYLATSKRIGLVYTDGYFYYNPPLTTVKYILNDAKQCEKYTACPIKFLKKASSGIDMKHVFEVFACGNIGRDVAMIAKSMPREKAIEMIRDFYNRPVLKEAINSDGWSRLGIKYRVIGNLLKKRQIEVIVFTAKLLAKRI